MKIIIRQTNGKVKKPSFITECEYKIDHVVENYNTIMEVNY